MQLFLNLDLFLIFYVNNQMSVVVKSTSNYFQNTIQRWFE